jgi:hypothetical protein
VTGTYLSPPDANWWQQDYDELDRPTWLSWEGASGITYINRFAHGGPQGVNRGNGTSTSLTYDGIQRAVTMANDYLTGDVAWTFGRNAAGQLNAIARDNDAYAWGGHYAVARAYVEGHPENIGAFEAFGGNLGNFGIEVPTGWSVSAISIQRETGRFRITRTRDAETRTRIRPSETTEKPLGK